MRDILFRGRSSATKEWFEGDLNHCENGIYICDSNGNFVLVDSETIGEYTNLSDKNNNKKIFEGDIICIPFTEDTEYGEHTYYEYGVVCFDEKYLAWCVKFDDGETMFLEEYDDCATVTGNIHDNPEFLKGG